MCDWSRMDIDKLSLSYRCHSAIGNSLKLESMIQEVLRVFMEETYAISGDFYLNETNQTIASIGKKIALNRAELFKDYAQGIEVKNHNNRFNIIVYSLQKGRIFLVYDKNIELNFFVNMLESFRKKLDISIDSCLNVEALKNTNAQLKDLTQNLQYRVDEAIASNKQKEKQIFEQLKMSQMGELIGNIAHQWRQPLSVISTATSGMRLQKEMDMLTNESFFNYSDSILNNVQFLSKTIDEFRDYIKESHREKEVVIQERVNMAISMVEASFGMADIEFIEEHMESKPLIFRLITGELLQVLISILNNAKDALIQNNTKKKTIKYSVYEMECSILITIEDNAGGIEEKNIHKIFNPYFTTKHKSQGTGIGLYTSYDIITNHLNGKLYVQNTEDGAKFFIELPLFMDYSI